MNDHQTLYRKWRPQRFAEVVGQAHTVRTLVNALVAGEVAHAYLFAGPRGTGKTTVARLFARAINCQQPRQGEPCNRCPACERIARGASLDVVEIDGASNRGIDQIRKLREEVSFVPADVRHKVYIIDEVHMLTNEAFNALLKTLEEPPQRVVFLFATTEPHKLPATVLSRCQAFEFARLPAELIARRLEEICRAEDIPAEPEALTAIATRAGGALRDALVTLEQVAAFARGRTLDRAAIETALGLPAQAVLEDFLRALLARDAAAALALLADQDERGHDLELFLEEALRTSRAWLVRRLAGEAVPHPAPAETLAALTEHLMRLKGELGRVWDVRIWLEVGLLRFLHETDPTEPQVPSPAPERPAPSRAEGAPSEPAPSAVPSEGSLDARWQALLEAIRDERVAVYAYLVEGRPALEGRTLRVVYAPHHRFHKESLDQPDVRDYVQAQVARLFGGDVRLEATFAAADAPSAAPSPQAPAASDLLEEKTALVEKVLGAKRLE